MGWLIAKYFLTAGLIMLISEVAKRSEKVGALITALPLVTITVLLWMHFEGEAMDKMGQYVGYVFWYSAPTMPMFILFPIVLEKIGFWPTLAASVVLTIACFAIEVVVLRRFGIELL